MKEDGLPMRRTFRVRSLLRPMVPLLVAGTITLVILTVITPPGELVAVGIVGLVLLASAGIGAWLLTRTRLEFSPEGITYHAIGYQVRGTWADVAGVGTRVQGASEYESLILRRPGLELSGWMAFAYRLMPAAMVVALLGGRSMPSVDLADQAGVIPVGLFDTGWRTGEIGSVIRTYAPAALDTRIE
jgi:hypothetical protein